MEYMDKTNKFYNLNLLLNISNNIELNTKNSINKFFFEITDFHSLDQNVNLNSYLLFNNVISNQINNVKKILKLNSKFCNDLYGRNPIFYSAVYGYLEITILLLQHNFDINQKDFDGSTVLHHVALFNNPIMLNMLIKYGADQHILDNFQRYPIFISFMNNNIDQIKEFIKCGFKVYERLNYNELNILHLAVMMNNEDLVKIIIDKPYNQIFKNIELKSNGMKPIDFAIKNKNTNIIKMLSNNDD